MSQEHRFRYDELLDNDLTQASGDGGGDALLSEANYPSHGHVRNLGFVWEDSRRLFLNYAYLVSAEYLPSERTIRLAFTTHDVTLKGIFLDDLYEALMSQVPRLIVCEDARYNATAEKGQMRVNSIDVVKLT